MNCSVPESNTQAPAMKLPQPSDVIVWGVVPCGVQRTVSPALMVVTLELKRKGAAGVTEMTVVAAWADWASECSSTRARANALRAVSLSSPGPRAA